MKNILIFTALLFSAHAFAQTKAVPVVTVVNNIATLDASKSTGIIGSFTWSATPAVAFPNGVYYAFNVATKLTVPVLPATKYVFRLTVFDAGGGSKMDSVVYNPVVIPPVVKGRTDTLYQYFMYSDSSKLKLRIIVWKDYTTTNITQ